MSNINKNDFADEKALEALLAAAYRLDLPGEISDEEADRLFQQPVRLPSEIKTACNSWGNSFIDKLIEGQKTSSKIYQKEILIDEQLEQEYFALNREKNGKDLDEETRRIIDEERKKALDEEGSLDEGKKNES